MNTATLDVIGRDEELATLRTFLRGTAPGALVLTGEPGVGKTTMWRAGVEAAKEMSFRVLEASPAEAEARMSFAALDDLLSGVIAETLPALPPPQRHALEVALLLTDTGDTPPEERAVAAAFLNALRLLSASRPTLIAIDDIQWLDVSSASVVGYALRRLRDEPVAMLLAQRADDGSAPPAELARALEGGGNTSSLPLGPLSLGALHRLLRDRLELVLARPALRRIHEMSGGNPFYALEIARALELQAPRASLGRALPVPRSLGELLETRVSALPPDTQRALLVAASLSEPRLRIVSDALALEARVALQPAIDAHIVSVEDERIRFTHTLFAAVAYARVDEVSRHAVHGRLAALVEDEEGKARHLALSTEGPDEVVATALESASAVALARGASAAAAELSEQALWLTPPERESDVRRRTIVTALHHFRAGDSTGALSLLEQALPSMPSGADRAHALALLQRVYRYEGDQLRAMELGREALAEPTTDDQVRAEAASELASTLFFLRENLEYALSVATIAVDSSAHEETRELHAHATAQKGVIEALLGHPEARATMRAADELGTRHFDSVINTARFDEGFVMLWFDDAAQAARVMHTSHAEALQSGDDGGIPLTLANLAAAEYLAGRWASAEQAADDGYEAAMQTGQRPQQAYSLSVRALVRASLGREHEARADASDALTLTGGRAMGAARIHSTWALGLLALSLDRPDEAVGVIAPLREELLAAGVGEPGSVRFVPDETEALIALGRLDEAGSLVDWLEERGRTLDRASALGAAARCRGLMSAAAGDLESATNELEHSLAEYARVEIPFEVARTVLALGATQRRARQKAAARTTLTRALAAFEELGAAIWADRARNELSRIGGRAPSGNRLTPTEERVAALVAEGCSNKEVAATLFMSVRTVDAHLAKIYSKLGIRSRTALARRSPQ